MILHPRDYAQSDPDRPAHIMYGSGESVSYAQLDARSNRCAQLLRNCGLKIGDGIAIFMENNIHYLELCWAAQCSGLYFTCIPTHLGVEEVQYIINDSNARIIFAGAETAHIAQALTGKIDDSINRYAVGCEIAGHQDYLQESAHLPAEPVSDETSGRDMLYSSGTTGRPKGIRVPLSGAPIHALNDLQKLTRSQYGFDRETIYLSPAPLYHAAPLRFTMLVQRFGGTVIIMEKFDAEKALAAIEHHRVTHSQWVPTMFIRMLKLPEEIRQAHDLRSHKIAIHAAAPCPKEVKQQMIEWWGPIIYEYYSGSEPCGLCCIDTKQWLANPGSVGPAVFGVLHIVDEQGTELGPGEEGLVYFANGQDFSYHQDPDKTAAVRNDRGWTTLGDLGYLNEEGYLFLTDRSANVIISGGINIYPQECENLLVTHQKVLDAAVFGVPNAEFGEEVKAVVQPVDICEAGSELEEELIAFCRQAISPVKCPRSIDFAPELPRQANGKLYKRLLKDDYRKQAYPNELNGELINRKNGPMKMGDVK